MMAWRLDPDRLRAVLFDLDGVLVHSYEVWYRLLNATASAFGKASISRDVFDSCWGQGIAADVERFFPGQTIPEVEAYYGSHFMDFAQHLRVDEHAASLLERLRRAGLRCALITNTPGDLARAILAHAKLELDAVVGGTDVASAKPAPDMVLEACRRLGVDAAESVVVGDSDYDAKAAAAADVQFIGFQREGDRRIDELQGLPSCLGL